MGWSFQANFEQKKGTYCASLAKALPEHSTKPNAAAIGMHQLNTKINRGFTLIELLVVVALLGIVSLAVVLSFDDAEADTLLQISKSEMVEIRKALRQFKADNGKYPYQTHPADFSQLTSRYTDTQLDALALESADERLVQYSPDTRRGWRGPYLTSDGNGWVTVGKDLSANGDGSILTNTSPPDFTEVAGVADSFAHVPSVNGLLKWRACTDAPESNAGCEPHSKWGRPYMLFDMDNGNARLVSMGPDGVYAGVNPEPDADLCAPYQDDLVMCLQ